MCDQHSATGLASITLQIETLNKKKTHPQVTKVNPRKSRERSDAIKMGYAWYNNLPKKMEI